MYSTIGHVAAHFLGCGWLSLVCTPSTLGLMDSSPSDLPAQVCFRSVRLSVLDLGLSCIANQLCHYVASHILGVVSCSSYAHFQPWALWTTIHQICLLKFVLGVCVHWFSSKD